MNSDGIARDQECYRTDHLRVSLVLLYRELQMAHDALQRSSHIFSDSHDLLPVLPLYAKYAKYAETLWPSRGNSS